MLTKPKQRVLADKATDNDLLRIGVYSQMEGSFRLHRGGVGGVGYRFGFALNQIDDIRELLDRVIYPPVETRGKVHVSFYCKPLYERLYEMGFRKFMSYDWNVPRCIMSSSSLRKEYLRAVIDSIGDVDVDRFSPYIRVASVNHDSMKELSNIFGGTLYKHRDTSYLQWKGSDAIRICRYLGWKFHCHRNIRGAELVKNSIWLLEHEDGDLDER